MKVPTTTHQCRVVSTNYRLTLLPFRTTRRCYRRISDKSRLIRIMGQPSFQASNAIVYVTYGVFLYVKPLGVCSCSQSQGETTNNHDTQFNGNCARLEIPPGIQGRVPFWKQNSDRSGEHSRGEIGGDEVETSILLPTSGLRLFQACLPSPPSPPFLYYEHWLTRYIAFPIALNFIASG